MVLWIAIVLLRNSIALWKYSTVETIHCACAHNGASGISGNRKWNGNGNGNGKSEMGGAAIWVGLPCTAPDHGVDEVIIASPAGPTEK